MGDFVTGHCTDRSCTNDTVPCLNNGLCINTTNISIIMNLSTPTSCTAVIKVITQSPVSTGYNNQVKLNPFVHNLKSARV